MTSLSRASLQRNVTMLSQLETDCARNPSLPDQRFIDVRYALTQAIGKTQNLDQIMQLGHMMHHLNALQAAFNARFMNHITDE